MQVLNKRVPVELIVERPELQEEWTHDRLQRQSAFMPAYGLCSQLEIITGKGISNWKLHVWAVIRVVGPREIRIAAPFCEFVIYNKDTEEMFVQLLLRALTCKYHILSNITDRGPINSTLLNFFVHKRYLKAASWGPFSRIWNCVKNSVEKAYKGRPCQCVLGFLLLPNISDFAFQSSRGFRNKQDAPNEYVHSGTFQDPAFQLISGGVS